MEECGLVCLKHGCVEQLVAWCRFQAAVGNLLANVIPRQKVVPAVKPEDLHPDSRVVEGFKSDPLIYHGNLRARTGNEILRAFKALGGQESSVVLPVYAVHGTVDATTSFPAVERFCKVVSSTDVTFRRIDGGYHELLMGDERNENADAIVDWIKARTSLVSTVSGVQPVADKSKL